MRESTAPDAAQPEKAEVHERRIMVLLAVIEVLWIAGLAYGLSVIL
jgi:F0F1-type ATP synthase membrane subunit c/vacuolar-type H+-ATPase subunit K